MEQLLSKFLNALSALSDELPRTSRTAEDYRSLDRKLDELSFELAKEANDLQAEGTDRIEINKRIFPQIESVRIREGLKFQISLNRPIAPADIQILYLHDLSKSLESLFRMNAFYYQYYRSGFTDLDQRLFLEQSRNTNLPIVEVPVSKDFPPISYLIAKFIAYEQILEFIVQEIHELRTGQSDRTFLDRDKVSLKWTGDVINIVELAYGLWLTGQLNNGNASLVQIVQWLEKDLGVKIGVAQRKFYDIERRKKISITRYIDQMKSAVLAKVENGAV